MATKTRRVVITLSERIVKDVDWLAPLEDMTRDELISEAVRRFLKPHLEIRAQVLKAAAKPGKTHGPFNSADKMIADMKGRLKKKRTEEQLLADPLRASHLQALKQAVDMLRKEATATGVAKMTMRQINAIVAEARHEQPKKEIRKREVVKNLR